MLRRCSAVSDVVVILAVLLTVFDVCLAFLPSPVFLRGAHPANVAHKLRATPALPRAESRTVTMVSAATDKQKQDFAHIEEKESTVERIAGPLKNEYFALRHGQSEANIADIISSDELRGSTIHGLTEEGRRQARASAADLLKVIDSERLQDLVFYSSNFTRARETAEEACAGLKELAPSVPAESLAVNVELGIRERWFGDLDNTIITNYNKVWPADWKDAGCTVYGVESVEAVCQRVKGVITGLESRHEGKQIVLVSHADTLQILQLYMAGTDVRHFSAFRFKNGEVRPLLLNDAAALPPPAPLEYKREDNH